MIRHRPTRGFWHGFMLLTVIWTTLLGSAQARDDVVLAKLGLYALSAANAQRLWREVKMYAQFEHFLAACGHPSHIESRVTAAVQACVTPQAIQQVTARFRANLAQEKHEWTPAACSRPQVQT